MRNVNSITGLSEAGFRKMRGQVLDMSKQLPQSATNLAEALYDISSSGFKGADALTVLDAAAIGASAGLAETKTAAKGISAVLNAYGMEAEKAAYVNNVLFEGVNVGVMTYQELSSNIGDFVGNASTANVSIDESVAALAAMTLTGISAAEGSTAYNRVLQSLIKPSQALSAEFKNLGYESGLQALEVLGLQGTMELLRESSGGNIEVLLEWFTEIRSARGALALMSDEGRNFADTSEAIRRAQDGQGSAQEVLNEQMKAWSTRLTIAKNNLTAFATEGGAAFLDWATRIAPYVGNVAKEIEQRLAPGFESLVRVGGALGPILYQVAEGARPIVALFGAIVGSWIEWTFTTLAEAAADVAEFMARNDIIMRSLGTAFAVFAAARYGPLVLGAIVRALMTMTMVGASAATSVSGLGAALSGISVTQGMFGAVAIAGGVAVNALMKAEAKAKEWRREAEAEVDPHNLETYQEAIDAATEKYAEATAVLEDSGLQGGSNWDRLRGSFEATVQAITPYKDTLWEAKAAQDEAGRSAQQLAQEHANTTAIYDAMADHFSTTPEAIQQAMESMDLTPALDMVDQHAAEMRVHFEGMAADAGYNAQEMEKFLALPQEDQDAIAESWKKLRDAVSEAWAAGGDLGSVFGGRQTVAEVEAGLAEIRERFRVQANDIAADAEGYGMRVAAVYQERDNELKAYVEQHAVTGEQIEQHYADQVWKQTMFANNISKAFEMGYDPQAVSRLLQQGPAEAGPIVEAMVSDTSGRLVEMVNSGEQALRDLNLRAVEMARLTHRATNAETAEMAANLGLAMEITNEMARQGSTATVQSIATELGKGVAEVALVGDQYGIEMTNATADMTTIAKLGANSSVREIADEMGKSPEQIRYIATSMGVQLDEGMQLMKALGQVGSQATAEEIAREMGIGVAEMRMIAASYGITLADAINPI
ncbi:MAG: phage tail tape measure protein, partial [Gemmatimonadota bacterium]|nr:phage tail tape measure protein [Gemmatimonadota bacterium]